VATDLYTHQAVSARFYAKAGAKVLLFYDIDKYFAEKIAQKPFFL